MPFTELPTAWRPPLTTLPAAFPTRSAEAWGAPPATSPSAEVGPKILDDVERQQRSNRLTKCGSGLQPRRVLQPSGKTRGREAVSRAPTTLVGSGEVLNETPDLRALPARLYPAARRARSTVRLSSRDCDPHHEAPRPNRGGHTTHVGHFRRQERLTGVGEHRVF